MLATISPIIDRRFFYYPHKGANKLTKKDLAVVWNKAQAKMELLADIERQIVNSQLNGNITNSLNLLKQYVIITNPYFSENKFMERIRAIEDKVSILKTPNMSGQMMVKTAAMRRVINRDFEDLQIEILEASRKAGFDIPNGQIRDLKERIQDALRS